MTKLLIVGGWDNVIGPIDNVDVIDLTFEIQGCLSPASYSFAGLYMVGTLIDKVPIVCGGQPDNGADSLTTNECYQYNHDSNIWAPTNQNMLDHRFGPAGSLVDSSTCHVPWVGECVGWGFCLEGVLTRIFKK